MGDNSRSPSLSLSLSLSLHYTAVLALFFLDWLCFGCSSSLIWQVTIHSTFAQTMEELSTEDLEL